MIDSCFLSLYHVLARLPPFIPNPWRSMLPHSIQQLGRFPSGRFFTGRRLGESGASESGRHNSGGRGQGGRFTVQYCKSKSCAWTDCANFWARRASGSGDKGAPLPSRLSFPFFPPQSCSERLFSSVLNLPAVILPLPPVVPLLLGFLCFDSTKFTSTPLMQLSLGSQATWGSQVTDDARSSLLALAPSFYLCPQLPSFPSNPDISPPPLLPLDM